MATDGPVTPEQTPPPAGERKGFLGRFKRDEAKPASRPTAPPSKEALPGKMGKVMAELKRKDQELDGNVISEFGEGEKKFIILQQPIHNDGTKYMPEGSFKYTDRQAYNDWLLVTNDGFRVLRVKEGTYRNSSETSQNRDPNAPVEFEATDEDRAFSWAVRSLVREGTSAYRNEIYTTAGRYEGSGHYVNPDTSTRIGFELNFGRAVNLEFEHDGSFWIESPYGHLAKQLAKAIYPRDFDQQKRLEYIRDDAARLILSPDPAEIEEIMKHNIQEAKSAKETKEAKRLEEEAKKLAEAEEAKKPEIERLKAEDTKRQETTRQAAQQSQAADNALDILGKL